MLLYEELRPFLTEALSVEELELFDRGMNVMTDLGVSEPMLPFEMILGRKEEIGEFHIASDMMSTMKTVIEGCLEEFQIRLTDDCTLSVAISVLDAINKLPQWEDRDRIRNIVDLQESPEETMCSICAEINCVSAEEYFPNIEEVGNALIDKISQILETRDDTQEFDDEKMKLIERIRKEHHGFKQVMKGAPHTSDTLIQFPHILGLTYQELVKMFCRSWSVLTEQPTETQIKIISDDLLGYAVLSDEGVSAAQKYSSQIFNEKHIELRAATAMQQYINQQVMEIKRASI
jgi:hypothetical protein